MVLLLVQPAIYIKSARDGILLFAVSVLPALFPFFFFSTFLTKLGVAKNIATLGKKPFRFLFNAPPLSAYVFTMSILSGYPIGAKLTSDFHTNNMLSSADAKKCAAFCSTSNPIFILGTVGSIMFNDVMVGVVILLAHYLSALLNGLLYRGRKRDISQTNSNPVLIDNCNNILSESIISATNSILIVGGFICVFTIFLNALTNVGVISFISSALSFVLPADITTTILSGMVEMTNGSYMASRLSVSKIISVPLCCAIISFGGLSILAQCITFLSRCKIKVKTIITQKLTQAIISFILCFVFSLALF
ncbi:MAG: hypothetical protein PHE93_02105 [Clostridia bacterium]|nr:hypothetical protein [Clostridia bacterium]